MVGLSSRAAAVVGWCGMRGIVTLAAALALPTDSFPFRDLILFTAFAVVLGTLVLQGLTLRPLMTALRLEDDLSVEHEVRLGRVETLRAALSTMDRAPEHGLAALLRQRMELQLEHAEGAQMATSGGADAEVVRAAISAERHRLATLRAEGTIGDAAFQLLEQELDLEELHFDQIAGDGDE